MKNFSQFSRSLPWLIALLVLGASTYGAWWLTMQSQEQKVVTDIKPVGSILSRITLTEYDTKGRLIWEVTAEKADYSEDKRTATILNVKGKFFRDGKPLIEATGEGGSINQVNKEITIEGNVKAIALKDNITLSSDRLVWKSDKDLLNATGKVRLEKVDQKIVITGKDLKAYPSTNRFVIDKEVVATTKDPDLRLEGPNLDWDANKNKIKANFPFRVIYDKQNMRLRADRGEWDIINKTVDFEGKVRGRELKLGLELNTSKMAWNIGKQMLTIPEILDFTSKDGNFKLIADQGAMDIAKQQITVSGNVQANSSPNQSTIAADSATWSIPTQIVTAEGNVNYRASEKDLSVKGDRAVANLAEQTVQVSGGDVVTNITP